MMLPHYLRPVQVTFSLSNLLDTDVGKKKKKKERRKTASIDTESYIVSKTLYTVVSNATLRALTLLHFPFLKAR